MNQNETINSLLLPKRGVDFRSGWSLSWGQIIARQSRPQNMMLVTKAFSQGVTHLAFVPLATKAARRSPTGSSARKRSVSGKSTSLERKSPPHFARAILLFPTKNLAITSRIARLSLLY